MPETEDLFLCINSFNLNDITQIGVIIVPLLQIKRTSKKFKELVQDCIAHVFGNRTGIKVRLTQKSILLTTLPYDVY